MNIKNNQRTQKTVSDIEKVFSDLLLEKDLKDISVMEICDRAGINRSTFYEKYDDVFVLAKAVAQRIEGQISQQPHTVGEFAWIFEYILANKDVFRTYFKLGCSYRETDYKRLFFVNGVYAAAKLWLNEGCKETPEQMGEILKREYAKCF